MYLTINRFRVKPGQEAAFEAVWTGRDSHLPQVKGFAGYHLFRGALRDGYRLCASHTLWDSAADFLAWTKYEVFRAAHQGAGDQRDLFLGPPELELFQSVQAISPWSRFSPASPGPPANRAPGPARTVAKGI
jgi:heme-degrading monooxygenase HmoA